MAKVNKDMLIGDIIATDQGVVPILLQSGMHCIGCPASQAETLEEACMVHGIDSDKLESDINSYLESK